MKVQITLEGKEVKAIIAKFFGIKEDQVIPLRYNFAVEGLSAEQIAEKLKK